MAQATRKEVPVLDALGRRIVLRKPHVLAQFHLVEALDRTATNEVYMGMVLPLIFVASIDGDPVVLPGSKAEVEALIKRLDESGIEVVMQGVQEHFAPAGTDAAKNG
jgi:hypothetical protein